MSVQTDYYIPQMKLKDEQISRQAAEITDLLKANQILQVLIGNRDKDVDRLRAALAPFAAEKLPSSRQTEIAYNRDGLRCSMSPLQIAQTAAFNAMKPTGERGA